VKHEVGQESVRSHQRRKEIVSEELDYRDQFEQTEMNINSTTDIFSSRTCERDGASVTSLLKGVDRAQNSEMVKW
jgi:hypothetical protein